MTSLSNVSLTTHSGADAERFLPTLERLYRTVYREPPYCEGEEDVADFVASLEQRRNQPSFRVVIAQSCTGEPIGFALGHQLQPGTRWWHGALAQLPDKVTTEYAGRTFAVIELAVTGPYRRRGVGHALHEQLVENLLVERLTLLVRPDALPAKAAYLSWGYEPVGQIQPFTGGPVYDVMLRARSAS